MTTVLVIEAEETIRWSFREILTRAGYRVSCADDIDEGVAVCERLRPRVIFVAVDRPDGDGSAVVDRLRSRLERGAAVVLMTASTETCTAEDARRLGAAAYLRKPFDFDRIEAVIDQVLHTGPPLGGAPKGCAGSFACGPVAGLWPPLDSVAVFL